MSQVQTRVQVFRRHRARVVEWEGPREKRCTPAARGRVPGWASGLIPSPVPLEGLPRLPDGLDVLLGLQAQRRDAAIARVRLVQRELVPEAGPARVGRRRRRRPEGLQAGAEGRGVQEGRWRRWCVAGWQALRRRPEARQALQRSGAPAGQRRPKPRFERQGAPRRPPASCRAGPQGRQGCGWRGAAEGEKGRVLKLHGRHFQLLLPPPLGPSVLEPHL